MTGFEGLNIASLVVGGITSISSAYTDSVARKAQAEYAQGIARANTIFAGAQADDAIARGEFLASEIRRKGDQQISYLHRKAAVLEGSQRTSYAAQGVESNSGSAADVIADSEFQAAHEESLVERNTKTDILTIKSNAWREAWGLKTQALSYQTQADMAGITARNLANASLLTGGLNAANYGLRAFAQYRMSAPVSKDSSDMNKVENQYQWGD